MKKSGDTDRHTQTQTDDTHPSRTIEFIPSGTKTFINGKEPCEPLLDLMGLVDLRSYFLFAVSLVCIRYHSLCLIYKLTEIRVKRKMAVVVVVVVVVFTAVCINLLWTPTFSGSVCEAGRRQRNRSGIVWIVVLLNLQSFCR